VETGEVNFDNSIVLSSYFENLAAAVLDWMAAREPQDEAVIEGEACKAAMTVPENRPPTARPARCATG
jgi:hypothetical protein